MTEQNIIKCSRCHMKYFESDFNINRLGQQNKTCKKCIQSRKCKHNIKKSQCKQCHGCLICEHNKIKSTCKQCNTKQYLAYLIRCRIYDTLKTQKTKHSIQYLGCSSDYFKKHIESQFTSKMNWNNHGKIWHIDHILPIMYNNPTIKEVIQRLHYTNTQPLLIKNNLEKSNNQPSMEEYLKYFKFQTQYNIQQNNKIDEKFNLLNQHFLTML